MKKLFLFFVLFIFSIFSFNTVFAESGIAVFQNSTYPSILQYQTWNETNFSSTGNLTNVGGTINYVVLKNNPVRKEQILGTLDSNYDLKIQFYNSTNNWTSSYNMTLTAGAIIYRSFDIAVEQLSGDVMVAYNNGTAGSFSYQVWNGSSWYKNGTVVLNVSTSAQINWIKLAANPVGNQIMLVAQTSTPRIGAHYWNGTAWSDSSFLDNVAPEVLFREDFDVEFENSGEALIVWANSVTVYPNQEVFSDM